eukprot:TRINITY_DN5904_c0_g1_i1.p1 TRINITY_DN5904_c0_g1~~TRINITY_DN5904_c0_g1_i1.p1  ORF type:complete len:357 (+),score=66.41 TRINITY_DN5904_c0_g1_i1:76-1146(+)
MDVGAFKHKFSSLGRWSKGFILLYLLSGLLYIASSIHSMVEDTDMSYWIAISSLVVVVFQASHAVFGVLKSNVFELYAVMTSQLVILISCGIRFLLDESGDFWSILAMGVSAGFLFVYLLLIYPLYREFTWRLYRTTGSDSTRRKNLRYYNVLLVLFRVDLLFLLSMIFAVFHFDLPGGGTDLAIDWCMGGGAFLHAIAGYVLHRYRVLPGIIIYWILSMVAPGYMVHVYIAHQSDINSLFSALDSFAWDTAHLYLLLLLFTATCFVIARTLTVVVSVLVTRTLGNFDPNGLHLEQDEGEGSDSDDLTEYVLDLEETRAENLGINDILRNTKMRGVLEHDLELEHDSIRQQFSVQH